MNKIDYYILSSVSVYLITAAFYATSWGQGLLNYFNISNGLLKPAIFVALYHGFVFTYNKYLFKYVHRNEYLGGSWIYRIDNKITNCKLYGIFTIEHNMYGIAIFFGKVWNNIPAGDNNILRGVWIGETIHYNKKRLQFVFNHSTLEKLDPKTLGDIKDHSVICGIAILDYYKVENTSELNGTYYDINDMNSSHGKWESKRVHVESADEHRKAAYAFRYHD